MKNNCSIQFVSVILAGALVLATAPAHADAWAVPKQTCVSFADSFKRQALSLEPPISPSRKIMKRDPAMGKSRRAIADQKWLESMRQRFHQRFIEGKANKFSKEEENRWVAIRDGGGLHAELVSEVGLFAVDGLIKEMAYKYANARKYPNASGVLEQYAKTMVAKHISTFNPRWRWSTYAYNWARKGIRMAWYKEFSGIVALPENVQLAIPRIRDYMDHIRENGDGTPTISEIAKAAKLSVEQTRDLLFAMNGDKSLSEPENEEKGSRTLLASLRDERISPEELLTSDAGPTEPFEKYKDQNLWSFLWGPQAEEKLSSLARSHPNGVRAFGGIIQDIRESYQILRMNGGQSLTTSEISERLAVRRNGGLLLKTTQDISRGLQWMELKGYPIRRIGDRWVVNGISKTTSFTMDIRTWDEKERQDWLALKNEDSAKAIAGRIEILMRVLNLDWETLGEKTNSNWRLWRDNFYKWRKGKNHPTEQVLEEISRLFGIEPSWLRYGRSRTEREEEVLHASVLGRPQSLIEEIRRRFKELRVAAGLSPHSLCAELPPKLKVNELQIRAFEAGIHDGFENPVLWESFASIMGHKPMVLLGGDEDPLQAIQALTLADKVLLARLLHGLRHEKQEMGSLLGVGKGATASWERGRTKPSDAIRERLAAMIGVPLKSFGASPTFPNSPAGLLEKIAKYSPLLLTKLISKSPRSTIRESLCLLIRFEIVSRTGQGSEAIVWIDERTKSVADDLVMQLKNLRAKSNRHEIEAMQRKIRSILSNQSNHANLINRSLSERA